jgi:DnaJ-class molecular chaperone
MSPPTFYDTLGVSKTSSESEIKKAYRGLSLKYHPDRNPNKEANDKMNDINGAYDILGDADSRRKYDMEQQLGLNMDDMPNMHNMPNMDEFQDINNIFNMMFRGIPGMNQTVHQTMQGHQPNVRMFHSNNGPGQFHVRTQFNGVRKPDPINKKVAISLEQAFTGCVVEVEITRQIEKDDEITNETETIYVNIPSGVNNTEVVMIQGKGHIINDTNSNINITIAIENNTHYIRQGLDIIFNKKISLKEALCGFITEFIYLNGKTFSLNNKDNYTVIKPGFNRVIPNMGMKRENNVGSLIIKFEIEFPDKLDDTTRQSISELL